MLSQLGLQDLKVFLETKQKQKDDKNETIF